MNKNIEHCPFLNRSDRRCAKHLNLSNLDHALEFCFDRFQDCPVHMELTVERRFHGQNSFTNVPSYAPSRLIQVKIPARYQKQSA
jgi:hypothetical protein